MAEILEKKCCVKKNSQGQISGLYDAVLTSRMCQSCKNVLSCHVSKLLLVLRARKQTTKAVLRYTDQQRRAEVNNMISRRGHHFFGTVCCKTRC